MRVITWYKQRKSKQACSECRSSVCTPCLNPELCPSVWRYDSVHFWVRGRLGWQENRFGTSLAFPFYKCLWPSLSFSRKKKPQQLLTIYSYSSEAHFYYLFSQSCLTTRSCPNCSFPGSIALHAVCSAASEQLTTNTESTGQGDRNRWASSVREEQEYSGFLKEPHCTIFLTKGKVGWKKHQIVTTSWYIRNLPVWRKHLQGVRFLGI